MITIWLGDEIYRAFGFPRALTEWYIKNSIVPDWCGGIEFVEFLIIKEQTEDKPIGFFIVYERRGGDPNQELDFAITDKDFGNIIILRHIEMCMFSYLFAVRGAKTIYWIRRKKKFKNSKTSQSNDSATYFQRQKPFVITLHHFKSMLELKSLRGEKVFPIIYTTN